MPNFDSDRGYDPYNHTGKQMRRQECWQQMRTAIMGNKVFVMDTPVYNALKTHIKERINPERPYWFGWDLASGASATLHGEQETGDE